MVPGSPLGEHRLRVCSPRRRSGNRSDTQGGRQMPLLHSKAIESNTLAVGRSRPLVLALSIGLGGFAFFASPNALKAMVAAPRLSDHEHIFKVHGSHRDCQYGSYREDGRRKEGWHRYKDGDVYTCRRGASSGSGDHTYSRGAGDSDRTGSSEAGSTYRGRSSSRDGSRSSMPPSFGGSEPSTTVATHSQRPVMNKKRRNVGSSSSKPHISRSWSRYRSLRRY